jgi:hypothetical protein
MRPRPTDEEFDELKRKRHEHIAEMVAEFCELEGCDPKEVHVHASHTTGCYCACPEGPCQHVWDGPEYIEHNMSSVTCSRCGAVAAYHDMRCAP